MATAKNPIIPGFYPDPSVCAADGDYYLVNSTFSYFPGIPIMHSKDLVHWEQIGNVMERNSQLPLEGCEHSEGIFAPTIRYCEGVFYVICTNVSGGGNFIVTAENPAGPWSEPVYLEDAEGIDPTVFFDDDGRVYYIGTRQPADGGAYDGECHIWIRELDLESKRLTGEPRDVWNGAMRFARWPEGPHLYKKDGYYYIMTAEGGTERNHSVMICRSRDLWGPYENCRANPILTHRHLGGEYPVQCVGHADMVETPDGEWYMVMLGMRPLEGYSTLGRETFLAKVVWEDGWPVVNPGVGRLTEEAETGLSDWIPAQTAAEHEREYRFGEMEALGCEFVYLRNPDASKYRLCPGEGLKLCYSEHTLAQKASPTYVGIRQQYHFFRASALILLSSVTDGQETGIALIQSNEYYLRLALSRGQAGDMFVRVYLCQQAEERLAAEKPLTGQGDEAQLVLEVAGLTAGVKVFRGEAETDAARGIDIRSLSTETAGGFVGCTVGLYAIGPDGAKDAAVCKEFSVKSANPVGK